MSKQIADIVFVFDPNDEEIIRLAISQALKNLCPRRVWVVSHRPDFAFPDERVSTVFERRFPFTKADVIQRLKNACPKADEAKLVRRSGWYLQQLLKLYSGEVLGLERYLIIDSDTLFNRAVEFQQGDRSCFNTGGEHHVPYFHHMARLLPGLKKVCDRSGICHHMVFDSALVRSLMAAVESRHGKKFWQVFLDVMDEKEVVRSGASEFEIYFNYVLTFHPERALVRNLAWKNTSTPDLQPTSITCRFIGMLGVPDRDAPVARGFSLLRPSNPQL